MQKCLTITEEQLIKNAEKVMKDPKYGSENKIIDEVLKTYPKNDNKSFVAMKICLIDLTNGTNLFKNLGTEGGLDKLAERITQVNFDERVKDGDLKLVEDLATWCKCKLGKNLFSFISKYCLYHNIHCYGGDAYVIYDSIVCSVIPKYITAEEFYDITKKKLYKNSFTKMKDEFNYHDYVKIIDRILEKNKIEINNPHRMLDWYLWYPNRNKKG